MRRRLRCADRPRGSVRGLRRCRWARRRPRTKASSSTSVSADHVGGAPDSGTAIRAAAVLSRRSRTSIRAARRRPTRRRAVGAQPAGPRLTMTTIGSRATWARRIGSRRWIRRLRPACPSVSWLCVAEGDERADVDQALGTPYAKASSITRLCSRSDRRRNRSTAARSSKYSVLRLCH